MNDEWMLPGTPREQYVTALRLLAGQCEAVARRIEAGTTRTTRMATSTCWRGRTSLRWPQRLRGRPRR